MGLIAAVLIPIILFFWLSFMLTLWAWLQTIFCLFQGKFIRATIWFSVGCGMLFWWFDEDVSFDEWWQMSLMFVVLGALATFAKFYNRHRQAVQTVTPSETPPFEPAPVVVNININIDPHTDHRTVHADLAAIASALRGAIGTEQGPRRISGPTISDHGG
jgi:hypothetical protein